MKTPSRQFVDAAVKGKPFQSPLRTAAVVFAGVFSNIRIERIGRDGTAKRQKVPISFSAKSNYAIWLADSETRKPTPPMEIRKQFPRMSYDIMGMERDSQRQRNPLMRNYSLRPEGHVGDHAYQPAAWKFDIKLSIWSKELGDSLDILNEIVPFFRPELTVAVMNSESPPAVEDCKIILKSISRTDNWSEGFEQNRVISWDLDFDMNGVFPEPARIGTLVTEVDISLFSSEG